MRIGEDASYAAAASASAWAARAWRVARRNAGPAATTLEQFGIANERRFPVRFIVKDGKPGDAIAESIAQHHPSVLVIGVKRTSETDGPHGTAFTILARSRVPVLCVPPQVAPAGHESESCAHVSVP